MHEHTDTALRGRPAGLLIGVLWVWIWLCHAGGAAAAERAAPGCKAPDAVCASSRRVYPVSSFAPVASAVLIEPGLLVTNRHVVADRDHAEIFTGDGPPIKAEVVPTAYPGDLILLQAPALRASGPAAVVPAAEGQQVYTIGADIGRGAVRVYIPGLVARTPAADNPLARIHHSARMLPSNSGGALVDREGTLVGIVASGGEGRNEAVPAAEIAKLKSLSGAAHKAASKKLGLAYKSCIDRLEMLHSDPHKRLDPSGVEGLYRSCLETGNRQLFDDAGRILGRQRFLDQAVDLFNRSIDQDPNGINTRLSLAITLHVAGRFEEEIPHLRNLIAVMPTDPQVLRFAIQAGKWSRNDAFAEKAFALLVQHHPQLKPVAEKFMNQPPPPRPGGMTPR
ncbi:MAG: trypsin-like peptidase domain-containing protein [Rhodospirillaceae bacterium]